jgi:hypothetical protein
MSTCGALVNPFGAVGDGGEPMLKDFSVLYAAHVLEGEGIDFAGIPAKDRWYANDQCARAFDIARDLARHIAAGVDFEDVLQKRAWICGTPAEIIDYLKDIEARYPGLEHLMLGFPFGATTAQFKAQLTRFAEEVIPAFQHPDVRVGR